jgi:hypothetical protein
MFTVVVSILPQSSADDGLTAMDKLLFWLGLGAAQKGAGSKPIRRRHWAVSLVVGVLCGADRRRNVSSARQSETIKLPQVPMHKMQAFAICHCHAAAQSRFCLRQVSVSQAWHRPSLSGLRGRRRRSRDPARTAGSRVGERQPRGAVNNNMPDDMPVGGLFG